MELSNYTRTLATSVQNRYVNRLKDLQLNVDPFLLEKKKEIKWFKINFDVNVTQKYPMIGEIDMYRYFVTRKSFYTYDKLKAYKSLEGYNYFLSNFVRNVRWTIKSGSEKLFIILAEVQHSQRTNEKPPEVWLITKQNGEIVTGHCKCFAGLGECCSHISAICFFFLGFHKGKENLSVTDIKAYWMQPSSKIPSPKKGFDICFKNVRKLRRELFSGQTKGEEDVKVQVSKKTKIVKLDDDFLAQVYKLRPEASILKVVQPYAQKINAKFPMSYENLYNDENTKLNFEALKKKGEQLNLELSLVQIKTIEFQTRSQSKSSRWFQFRTGRITASNAHAVSHVKSLSSNVSLIKKIVYPSNAKFSSKATEWGCNHEKDAIQQYLNTRKQQNHVNHRFRQCGLFINEKIPYIGASPDGIVMCDCCGFGLIEVKCPYCLNEKELEDLMYLLEENGERYLNRSHQYYYQVITQLHTVDGAKYCDFVVWSPKREIFIERITHDSNVWKLITENARFFFYGAVMPELLAQFYTSNNRLADENQTPDPPFVFCYCKSNQRGKVIMCSKQGCPTIIYHMKCVNVQRKSKNWMCPECVPKPIPKPARKRVPKPAPKPK